MGLDTHKETETSTISTRPHIDLVDGKIVRDGKPVMVSFRRDRIRVGCSDISPEAASFLLGKYSEFFPRHAEVVLQP